MPHRNANVAKKNGCLVENFGQLAIFNKRTGGLRLKLAPGQRHAAFPASRVRHPQPLFHIQVKEEKADERVRASTDPFVSFSFPRFSFLPLLLPSTRYSSIAQVYLPVFALDAAFRSRPKGTMNALIATKLLNLVIARIRQRRKERGG